MSEDNGVNPLLEAKRKIEEAIATYLEKVALLRKRSEALQQAINVLRSSDEELATLMPIGLRRVKQARRFTSVSSLETARKQVVSLLTGGEASFKEIFKAMEDSDISVSEFSLRKILASEPFKRRGERHMTVYGL